MKFISIYDQIGIVEREIFAEGEQEVKVDRSLTHDVRQFCRCLFQ